MEQRWLRVVLAAVFALMLPVSTKAQPPTDPASKESPASSGANGESDRDLLPDLLDNSNEPEDRLVRVERDASAYALRSSLKRIPLHEARPRQALVTHEGTRP